jgi:hypothetical protein
MTAIKRKCQDKTVKKGQPGQDRTAKIHRTLRKDSQERRLIGQENKDGNPGKGHPEQDC